MIIYRFEYCGNPDYVELHLNKQLSETDFASDLSTNGDTDNSALINPILFVRKY